MGELEWLPVKPCKRCPEGDGFSYDECIEGHYIEDCIHFVGFKKARIAQKRLLEYQLKIAVTMDELKSMLKQLDTLNDRK